MMQNHHQVKVVTLIIFLQHSAMFGKAGFLNKTA